MKKNIYNIAVLAIAGFAGLVTSCSNDFDFDEARRENPEFAFKENFEKAFGAIDPNQSWDFTRGVQLGTRAGDAPVIQTISGGIDFGYNETVKEGKIDHKDPINDPSKNVSLVTDLKAKLPDGQKHDAQQVILAAPDNAFIIFPLMAQGQYTHDLYVKVGDANEVKVYTKDWTDFSIPYFNGMGTTISNGTITKKVNFPGLYVEAEIGTPIQIYLKNIKNGRNSVTSKLIGTGSGNAIYVDCDVKPDIVGKTITTDQGTTIDIPEDAVVKFIGIEDQENLGDKDYNDIVLCVVGVPEVPKEINIVDNEYSYKKNSSKRYMVEDLGATSESDIDFNDLVVDVTEELEEFYVAQNVNGVYVSGMTAVTAKQTFKIYALGGTKDIALYIGEQTTPIFRKSTEQTHLNASYRENNIVTGNLTSLTTDYMYNTGFYKADPSYRTPIAVYEKTLTLNTTPGDPMTITKKSADGKSTYTESVPTINSTYSRSDVDWNPATNNIYVVVADEESDFPDVFSPVSNKDEITPGVTVLKFPSSGEIPTMIAVDPSQNWNYERVSVFPEDNPYYNTTKCPLKLVDYRVQ